MNKVNKVLTIAKEAQIKFPDLNEHMESITLLRNKGFSWRDIAKILTENGIKIEHTKLSRIAKANYIETNLSNDTPLAKDYFFALSKIKIPNDAKTMLMYHFNQPNRTVTYSQLSKSVGHNSFRYANNIYGNFAKKLCSELNFKPHKSASGRSFFGSVIGMKYAYAMPNDEFQLVMHHELSKAIENLNRSKGEYN